MPGCDLCLIDGPRRHDHRVVAVHHRLTIVRLREVPPTRRGHDPGPNISKVALGFMVRDSWQCSALRFRLLRRRPLTVAQFPV